ncbi:MAG: hypothetical protein ACI4VW_04075 [Acutalibacteraceae bacterium]
MKKLTLKVVTPNQAVESVECDSIQLTVSDNEKGKGGGSYGIKQGHVESIISLNEGVIKAFLNGKTVLCGKSKGGFATVKNNTVTAVVDSFIKE